MDEDDRTQVQRRTVAPGASALAGAAPRPPEEDSHALPIGTRLDEFELIGRIGEGGFSIVYLAWDHSLDRKVAVKEYMPGSLAARTGPTQIRPRSDRHRETFEAGLKSFINEAKLLAQFDHPALVKVYRFWEANGTAYLVMPLYDGVTLKDTVRAMPQRPDEDWLIRLLTPLTAALNVIHEAHCYHRDIAPDNIMLLADGGKPLLLDFGAARRVIGDMTQALTVILKPGYAPLEQYAEVPGMKQGPWTDVYALAATVYWAVTGKIPPPAVGRMVADAYLPLAQAAAGRYSAGFLQAIDRALIVQPEGRTQTIGELRRDLGIDGAPRTMTLLTEPPVDNDLTVILPRTDARMPLRTAAPPPPTSSGTKPPEPVAKTGPRTVSSDTGTSVITTTPTTSRRGLVLGLGATVALVAAAAAIWWVMRPTPAPMPTTTPHATAPDVGATTSASAPAFAGAASATPAVEANKSAVVAPADNAASPVVLPPPAEAKPPPILVTPGTEAAGTTAGPVTTTKHDRPPRTPGKPDASAEAKADVAARNAECAQIYQRLSLGETRPELLQRAKALNCR